MAVALAMPLHSGVWLDLPGFPRSDASAVAASSANSATDGITTSSAGGAVDIWLSSLGSGTVTFTLWDSADNSTFAAVSGFGTAALGAPGHALLLVNGSTTLRKYLAIATSGVFTNAVFECQVMRG